jgi:hypothetical protein
MSTVPLPMKRFVEPPPGVVLALADGEADADEVGEATPDGEAAASSATLASVLVSGPGLPVSDDGPLQPATATSMAAATAIVNRGCQVRDHRKDRMSMNSYVVAGL